MISVLRLLKIDSGKQEVYCTLEVTVRTSKVNVFENAEGRGLIIRSVHDWHSSYSTLGDFQNFSRIDLSHISRPYRQKSSRFGRNDPSVFYHGKEKKFQECYLSMSQTNVHYSISICWLEPMTHRFKLSALTYRTTDLGTIMQNKGKYDD